MTDAHTTPADPSGRGLRFIIIGAGMSGILSAIKLREAGLDFTVYEKAERLGGTWRENTYAGITCDVPSHFYSYSFALNPDWSQQFSPGSEIQAYFEDVAHRYEIDKEIRFCREVTAAVFENGRWHIELSDGSSDVGDFLIAATGVLHHPAYPEIEGLDEFEGDCFHSARWDHDVPLAGKRVGLIGTGSTAIQITSAVIEEVEKLSVFQRTAQWIMPVPNASFSDEERAAFRRDPESMQSLRDEVNRSFTDGFANVLGNADSPIIRAIHDACEANLENSVKDPELREKLRPNYRAACKRLIMSGDFYDAIQRPNASLVTEGIERVEKSGLRTQDGTLHELDILILATGFRVDQFVRPMHIAGRGGMLLDEVWKEGPFAYMAIMVPEFPNFFMLNGPNSPVGNFSLIEVAELQFDYIMRVVEQVQASACSQISPSPAAMERFDSERREAAKTTIWNTGCRSWYLDAKGLPTAWPFTFDRFREEMGQPRLDDHDMR